jgi:spore maturation protein A
LYLITKNVIFSVIVKKAKAGDICGMMSYIFAFMILVSLVFSFFNGNTQEVVDQAFAGAQQAVTMSISLLGMMCMWTGLMRIAERAGLVDLFSRLLSPITRFLFPQVPRASKAMGAITTNMVANIFGLSNAATPFGIEAMNELTKLSRQSGKASNAMCMFVVINTASIQLIPSTIIALRSAAGSQNPYEIIVPIWICSICAIAVGVIAAKWMERKERI